MITNIAKLKKVLAEESEFEQYFDRRPLEERLEDLPEDLRAAFRARYQERDRAFAEVESSKKALEQEVQKYVKAGSRGLLSTIEAVGKISEIYLKFLLHAKASIPDLKPEVLGQDDVVLRLHKEYLAPIHSMQASLEQEFKDHIKSIVG